MVLIRRIHNRGANIVVEANGEILFFPGGDVANWQRRFSARVREATAAEAPFNKRPRWSHYGKPLKTTFTASTTAQPGRMKVYSAVGSKAPYAAYVDQGTGVYGGRGPYEAKILPPWHRGSPSLYESTWVPPGSGGRVGPVVIKGQRGQGFFDKGLKRGFQSMRMRSAQLPIEGKIGATMRDLPASLLNVLGNTPADAAFVAQLEEWRLWRDAAWRDHRELSARLGPTNHVGRREFQRQQLRATRRALTRAEYKKREAERSRKNREKAKRVKSNAKPDRVKKQPLVAIQKAQISAKAEIARFFKNPKHRGFEYSGSYSSSGFDYFDRGGTRHTHFWSTTTADLFANAGVQHQPRR